LRCGLVTRCGSNSYNLRLQTAAGPIFRRRRSIAWVRFNKTRLKFALDQVADLFSRESPPPRREPIHLTFAFHVEEIAIREVFEPFREFVANLRAVTGSKPLLCVTTPLCDQTREQMEQADTSETEYAERVRALAGDAVIGYHGHFFDRPKGPRPELELPPFRDMPWHGKLAPVNREHFDADLVARQISAEVQWLRDIGLPPRAYAAGWWFLTEEIVLRLEREGIEIDCSIRQKHRDTFGGKYIEDEDVPPRGEPFILPPSKGIVEIQSVFYPIEHPRRSLGHLSETMRHKPETPLFLAIPCHESEALHFTREVMTNVDCFRKAEKTFRWTDIEEQKAIISRKGLA